jgi:hypothetical protein
MNRKRSPDRDRFARIPVEVMQSPALMTAPHAAFRVLAILVAGNIKERNGTFACSDSYAATFGMTSKETLQRSLNKLQERGLVVRTRPGMKLRRWPSLWAVTWWPIYYRDGQPLDRPEDPTHAYARWKPTEKKLHPDSRGRVTPMVGVKDVELHPDLTAKSTRFHPDSRGNSRSGSGGQRMRQGKEAGSRSDSDSLARIPSRNNSGAQKIEKLIRLPSNLLDGDIAKITGETIELVQKVRETMR